MAKKKKAKPAKAAAPTDESFEDALAELDSIVADLEGGELGLDESLARYEEGVARLRRCHAELESAERRIELLSGIDAEGNPVTEPFDAEATTDPSARSAKRVAGNRKRRDVDDSSSLF